MNLQDETRQKYVVEVRPTCSKLQGAGDLDIEINKPGDYCLAPGEKLLVSITSAAERSQLGFDTFEIQEVRNCESQAEIKAAHMAEQFPLPTGWRSLRHMLNTASC